MKRLLALLALVIAAQDGLVAESTPNSCSISVSKEESEWESRGNGEATKQSTYTIYLKNNTPTPLSNIKVEYRIYQNNNNGGKKFISSNLESERIETIAPNSTHTFPIRTSSFKRNSPVLQWEKIGIRARIYLPAEDGKEIMKEIVSPPTLSKTECKWELQKHNDAEAKNHSVYRTFITTNEIQMTAELLGFSESSGSVKLQTKEGSKKTVKIDSLSKEDQDYIHDWYPAYSLLSKKMLRIDIEENATEDQLYHGTLEDWAEMFPNMGYTRDWHTTFPGTTYDDVYYTISIENRSKLLQKEITVEYCIYHESIVDERFEETVFEKAAGGMSRWYPAGHVENYPERTVANTIRGVFVLNNLADRERASEQTKRLKLIRKDDEFKSEALSGFSHETGDKGTRNTRTIEGDLLGIRYRVYVPTPNGNWAMMEFAEPNSLLKETSWPGE